jgi:hypothetical protein
MLRGVSSTTLHLLITAALGVALVGVGAPGLHAALHHHIPSFLDSLGEKGTMYSSIGTIALGGTLTAGAIACMIHSVLNPPQKIILEPEPLGEKLRAAIEKYDVEDVNAYLNDVDLNMSEVDDDGNTFLHLAANLRPGERSETIAKAILEKMQVIDIKNNDGETPLHIAYRSNNDFVVQQLLDRGADPWLLNNMSKTPLQLAEQAEKPATNSL